ncbi:kinase-like domain-containing protein [Rhizophagus irregularis DAOM 181602=DAOM 197198]|uniref:Uncharacterized protein n=1 Tax=Rhizophagus irregularis (strain DAOM 181602 / DAOM 197198 / MUCL 43194) TaxID=747089 RepID=A0A2P4PHB6_RHIID|nr:hypothetical protein GLOIN_2v1782470 [Rhizophagus irregularis DAOM 181602=DAOM 197198]POG64775.1 hypothetical protein GLOIN_2v1782470 [Rhizophagus irregularis DAOM 181602=DAOM 197198]GET58353.1 kinase-like domain-containing protein [Rhizophagus irregularis DAOM 181602=DAOM 197198]|eukprot:XP_025171641.1 hypothetical protein GLOIN_2v1782470 [Rhizophagus irregularis DAOM 181602=DAOM 197198]
MEFSKDIYLLQRLFEKRQKTLVEIKNCQTDILKIIEINFLSEININLLEGISSNNQELCLHDCRLAKRPSSKEVLNIIKEWIIDPYVYRIEDINEGLKCDDMEIMEFINTPIGHNNLATKSHPQAYYTSCLL